MRNLVVSLDLSAVNKAKILRMAEEARTDEDALVTGIVQLYLANGCRFYPRPRPARDRMVMDDEGNTFPTAASAARFHGLHARLVSEVLHGRRNSTGGRTFRFV